VCPRMQAFGKGTQSDDGEGKQAKWP
jgi:hypothetical protein